MNLSKNSLKAIDNIFNPASIAIVGASENPASFGYQFMKYVIDYGYRGKIYPVSPKAKQIMGHKSYADLLGIPGNVDYVICCIKASLVINLLYQCAQKNVKGVHLLTGRLSETGNIESKKLEKDIANIAKEFGIHLIGPNCVGIYNPKVGIGFNHDLPKESGSVGAIVQSGGVGGELVRYAGIRGIRFSKAVSYGNAADLNESDFLEYFFYDDNTKLIVLYIEGVRDGPRFVRTLDRVTKKKPVLVLKGGKGEVGLRAVASHTASMAGRADIWETLCRQVNIVNASGISELIDLMVTFDFLHPFAGKKVGVIGGGGGKSILAADQCEAAGLKVIPMPDYTKSFIKSKDEALAGWMDNPVDFSILSGPNITSRDLLNTMATDPDFDLLIANLTEDNPYGEKLWTEWIKNETKEYLNIASKKLKPLAVVIGNPEIGFQEHKHWRWKTMSEQRTILTDAKIPVFNSADRAASSLVKMTTYYKKLIKN